MLPSYHSCHSAPAKLREARQAGEVLSKRAATTGVDTSCGPTATASRPAFDAGALLQGMAAL
eukprot:scaffold2917_cov59-Phaeocystis_antarctica.AAC.1